MDRLDLEDKYSEEPSYTDRIYGDLEEKVRLVVRLEKEISDKDFEIQCMQERIDYMKKTMNDMVTMVKESK
jgi:hypothetical protein|tara:strand:- start:235 stop:447 length:213 start_codon:yes stop_codon:yes gene_type:complete